MDNLYTEYYKQHPDKFLEKFFGIRLSLWQKFIIKQSSMEKKRESNTQEQEL